MKKMWIGILLIATACLATSPQVEVSGNWIGEIKGQDGGRGTVRFALKQAGGQVSGTAGPSDKQDLPQIYEGILQGNHLSFAADDSDEGGLKVVYRFYLTVTGDRIVGKAHGRSGDRSWTFDVFMTRDKD